MPRSTKVAWDYSPEKGELATTWTLQTENLAGAPDLDVVQGWIPHHYDTAHGVRPEFAFNNLTYATPRGLMKCAVGRTFRIVYPFRGLLPELPAPTVAADRPNPYRPDVMKALVDGHADETGYGSETYWGGKKILLFAKYMEMAYQLGLKDEAALYQGRLREALVDWATYRPGEKEHFFAMYPNWGSLVGFRTRDNQNPGIDVLQDHAFCYGYHVYAAALLAIHDPDFARDYGGMATLMVKDYANWDPADTRFCTFRSLDPWCGHSWSGGMGSDTGNGQESSSEAMQAWGAMFTLGSVLENRAMRDAAVFGYVSEARAVAEYWFDRDKKNIPRPLWPHAYNGNQETNGVGWWTWFSGDEFWMHAIQWLPMSPLLKYLSEDLDFARWDYETMMRDKRIGGFESNLGNESGVGNVALSYLQIFDPDGAAAIFDQLWDGNRKTAHAKDESGPTYYRIHAGRALGTIRWDAWTDLPTSTVYRNAAGRTVVAVYNTSAQEKTCHLYENGRNTAAFTVPARRLVAWTAGDPTPPAPLDTVLPAANVPPPPAPTGPPSLARIEIEPADALLSDRATQRFTAKAFDQYGKPVAITPTWSVRGKGRIDATGLFTPDGAGNFEQPHTDIVATAGPVTATAWAAVEESRRVAGIELTPAAPPGLKMAVGSTRRFRAEAQDQFGARYVLPLTWSATGSVQVSADGRVTAGQAGDGSFAVEAGGQRTVVPVKVVPPEQVNLAANRPVVASSVENDKSPAACAVDGDERTRWSSAFSDPQWITVDLEAPYTLRRIVLNWQNAAGKVYEIEVSADGAHWVSVAKVADGRPGVREFDAGGVRGRYLRVTGTQRTTGYGYSLNEIEAYGTP
ncbi:MAG: discoidin domain-containing protein [Gluconacetobacter diazotrophicus]|nr:discoidin domain-containing protein [Gluconacetobacter diazotrophicus]